MEMTITRGLAELKLLDSRINRSINEAVLGSNSVGKKLPTGYNSVEDVEKRAKSDYQSVKDLLKRRNSIKSAIVLSNATTVVEVAGVKMTVAEAIERKTSISYEEQLLSKMRSTYTQVVNHVDRINNEMNARLDSHLETLFGKEGKVNPQSHEDIVKAFKADNEATFIDPINLEKQINELVKSIEDFNMECDFTLSESNTITRITIED